MSEANRSHIRTSDCSTVRPLEDLDVNRFSRRHKFADWPNPDLPRATAGVYAIWDCSALIYCGMSGRQFEKRLPSVTTKFGLVTRLASHSAGRLSGDQFCVYVANRFVIPSLKPEQLQKFSSGELNLDKLTRAYIHRRLEYQFALAQSSKEAYSLEQKCREGTEFGVKPLLNPRSNVDADEAVMAADRQ